jgi:hypothetical protein
MDGKWQCCSVLGFEKDGCKMIGNVLVVVIFVDAIVLGFGENGWKMVEFMCCRVW